MKNSCRIICIACLLAVGSAANGAVLTSFESPGELFPTTTTNTPIAQSSQNVTHGTASMALGVASGNWNWSTKNYGASSYADWWGNTNMTIDLTRVTTGNAGNIEFVMAINGPQGWQQKQLMNWPWQNANTTASYTGGSALTWDYTAIRNAAPAPTAGDYFQINIMARSTYTGQTVYLDNIQFTGAVPEPGSFTLLSLAGVGLVFRRRR